MKVLVIGGAGYIGSHVVSALAHEGHRIWVFDITDDFMNVENIEGDITSIQGDIREYRQISGCMEEFKPDVVIHLAGLKAVGESMKDPLSYIDTNIKGTINILNAMVEHNIKNIVFSSSAAVYGNPDIRYYDEHRDTNPINFYGYTKLCVEELLKWYDKLKGIRYVALRYFNAAGYDNNKFNKLDKTPQNLLPIIGEVISKCYPRKELVIYGDNYMTDDGTCVRDYISVIDLATAHLRAMTYLINGFKSDVFNLGTGCGTSVKEIVDITKKLCKKYKRKFNYKVGERRPGDPDELICNPDKARRVLCWRHTHHSDLEEMINSTLVAYGIIPKT